MSETYLYIGNRPAFTSQSRSDSKIKYPISVLRYNDKTACAETVQEFYHTHPISAGKVHVDTQRRVLYVTDDVASSPGADCCGGCVYALKIDCAGKLSFLCQQPSFASKTAYVTEDDSGQYLLIANHGDRSEVKYSRRGEDGKFHIYSAYDESNIVLYPLLDGGIIGEALDIFTLSGSGPKHFQKNSHAHCIVKAPGKNIYVVCDKGGDQIFTFAIDYGKKCLKLLDKPVQRFPGSAPRYCVFHPELPYLYVNKESSPRLTAFRFDADGILSEIQTIEDTIPPDRQRPAHDALYQSDIVIGRSGTVLYQFIRSVNIINVYSIDADGRLDLRQIFDTPSGARAADISPSGNHMAVSYPELGRVDILKLGEDGGICGTANSISQVSPATVNFCTL